MMLSPMPSAVSNPKGKIQNLSYSNVQQASIRCFKSQRENSKQNLQKAYIEGYYGFKSQRENSKPLPLPQRKRRSRCFKSQREKSKLYDFWLFKLIPNLFQIPKGKSQNTSQAENGTQPQLSFKSPKGKVKTARKSPFSRLPIRK